MRRLQHPRRRAADVRVPPARGVGAGRTITTIEGLADGAPLSPVQDAFVRNGGFQCGFCTPGQLIAAVALLAENPDPTEREVRDWMSGNLCRCTGYRGIVDAVLAAARQIDEGPPRTADQSSRP